MSESCAVVYRVYGADEELLYVGVSVQPQKRLMSHQSQAEWWGRVATIKLEHCASREAALVAERKAIEEEQPLLNIRRGPTAAPDRTGIVSVRLGKDRIAALRLIAEAEHRSVVGQIRHLVTVALAEEASAA